MNHPAGLLIFFLVSVIPAYAVLSQHYPVFGAVAALGIGYIVMFVADVLL